MTKCRLRSAKREEAMESAFPGFKEDLQKAYEYHWNDPGCCLPVDGLRGEGGCWRVLIPKLDLEEIPEVGYDPDKWNKYPEVIPPEGAYMAAGCGNSHWARTCAQYIGNTWFDYNTNKPLDITGGLLFKEWK